MSAVIAKAVNPAFRRYVRATTVSPDMITVEARMMSGLPNLENYTSPPFLNTTA
jgi:hypothetical protein